jgi:hypothetical protein
MPDPKTIIKPGQFSMEIPGQTSAEIDRGGTELNISPWEFEQIQFAVSHTMSLASDLERAFTKEFEEGAGT